MLSREEINRRRRERYKDPLYKAKRAAIDKKRYKEKRLTILAQKKQYHLQNREEILKKHSDYYIAKREVLLKKSSEYRLKNQDKINAYFRNKYAADADYKRKKNTRSATWYLVKSGKLEKLPCSICGATTHVQSHHEDYNDRVNVRWLCEQHHRELHKERML